ncbi:formate/nitrite transporter family protein [Occallatibacter savannae]|uniref:formate/nitrite transporter family protein n=1 Tax=Occallatibacter savannae TaxID=1002691 RepID=UPI000D6947C0|nr:formate/nitrite transporter family protein [Occallatibacter savannae]
MPKTNTNKIEEPKSSSEGKQKDLQRPSAEDIYEQVAENARLELQRPSIALALSGFGAGAFMGLSALGTAIGFALVNDSPHARILSRMFYPLGFIAVIIGRSQLFTENTLYPVALVLKEKRQLLNTLRLWAVVLPANVLGAFAFAMLATHTSAIEPTFVSTMSELGGKAIAHPASTVFWSGVIAGWMIALAAWLVSASHSITGSVMVIWMLTYVVGLGDFAHCIASSCEIITTVLTHHAPWVAYFHWFGPAVLGNIFGGVCLVTILEYGQVIYGSDSAEKNQ